MIMLLSSNLSLALSIVHEVIWEGWIFSHGMKDGKLRLFDN